LGQAIQKISNNSQFFRKGGEDLGQLLFKPQAIISLHTQETPMEEIQDVEVVETKNIRQGLAPGGRREVIKTGLIDNTGKEVALSKWLQSREEGKYKAEKYWAENLKKERTK
jgi:hypothetical protein